MEVSKYMKRFEAIRVLNKYLKDELVIATIAGATSELHAINDRENNLYMVAMGLASSVGLGLALALPNKKVAVLDGDGSLLMNLGSLATIANQNPKNLLLIVFDNECYEGAGGQPTATSGLTDLAAIGKGAGIKNSIRIDTLSDFESTVNKALKVDELYFIVAKVEKWREPVEAMGIDHFENTYRFFRSLAKQGLIPFWHEFQL